MELPMPVTDLLPTGFGVLDSRQATTLTDHN